MIIYPNPVANKNIDKYQRKRDDMGRRDASASRNIPPLLHPPWNPWPTGKTQRHHFKYVFWYVYLHQLLHPLWNPWPTSKIQFIRRHLFKYIFWYVYLLPLLHPPWNLRSSFAQHSFKDITLNVSFDIFISFSSFIPSGTLDQPVWSSFAPDIQRHHFKCIFWYVY